MVAVAAAQYITMLQELLPPKLHHRGNWNNACTPLVLKEGTCQYTITFCWVTSILERMLNKSRNIN